MLFSEGESGSHLASILTRVHRFKGSQKVDGKKESLEILKVFAQTLNRFYNYMKTVMRSTYVKLIFIFVFYMFKCIILNFPT